MTLVDGLITWVHLMSSSIWVGGSIFIGVVLVSVLKSHTRSVQELVRLVIKVGRRFDKLALPAFAILIATGIYDTQPFLSKPAALLGSRLWTHVTCQDNRCSGYGRHLCNACQALQLQT